MQCCKNKPDAVARIAGGEEASQLYGCVRFYQENGCVLVEAKISGLPMTSETGFFGFHIHQGIDCSGTGFPGTEGRYNPLGQGHPKHAGDLPPLLLCQGNAYLSVKTDRFSVDKIIGRTVVIHSDPDDFLSQPAGNAGKKIACGVIQKKMITDNEKHAAVRPIWSYRRVAVYGSSMHFITSYLLAFLYAILV